MKCPACGSEHQKGKFCSQCGAALQGGCDACGSELPSGSRFCTQCGTQVGAAPFSPRNLPWPWIVTGVALALVVLVFLLPDRTERAGPVDMTGPAAGTAPFAAPGGSAPGGAMSADGLLSSDMRTNADRLFNRIMAAAQQGNAAEVARFMPMAVQAYGMVEDLDNDGILHLAILHLTGGDPASALATAERILEDSPNHILALGVAASAAERLEEPQRARQFHQRLLDAYPEEAAKPLPEYQDHQPMLPEYRQAAEEATGA